MYKRTFTYPGSDLDRGKALVATLGTFWSRIYTARDQVQSYTTASAVLTAQTYRNILETVQALSRFDVPVFHEQHWVPISIRRSDLGSGRVVNNFFNGTQDKFDLTSAIFNGVAASELFYFPAPANMVRLGQIFNQIIYPTVALIENVDYFVDSKSNALVFVANPFDNPGFLRRPAATGGNEDEEIVLWGFSGQFDHELVFNHFAYAIGLRLKSSQGYKEFTNAVIDGLVAGGATSADLDMSLSALSGVPLTAAPRERIEVIDIDTHGLLIGTDKNIYRFNADATPLVAVGQEVFAGTQLIDSFEIDEFFVGNTYDPAVRRGDEICCPAPGSVLATNAFGNLLTEGADEILIDPNAPVCRPKNTLTALALDSGFLSACLYGDLVFENKEVPLVVDTNHASGYTFVRFAVAGLPTDVDRFFEEIQYRGVMAAERAKPLVVSTEAALNTVPTSQRFAGLYAEVLQPNQFWRLTADLQTWEPAACPVKAPHTLAQFLDKRKNAISEPGAQHLPATINPLRFIVENVLRNNVFVVKFKVDALGRNRLGLYNIRHLRQLLPPGTAMLLVFDLKTPTHKIDGEDAIHENTKFFVGMEPAADTVDETLIRDMGATVRLFSGSCQ